MKVHGTPALWCWIVSAIMSVPDGRRPSAAAEDGTHSAETLNSFDIVIAGGSVAALAAGLAAAESGCRVALLEPTDWIGGQLTSSGVPAVDECWHQVLDPATKSVLFSASEIARDPRNMTPGFRDMFTRIGNPGRGWVSRYCFEPAHLLARELYPQTQRVANRLTIFHETVPKRVETDREQRRIRAVIAIQRRARTNLPWNGYDRLPSEDLRDWYQDRDSDRFHKSVLTFQGGKSTVFIDATEWGEILALSDAPFLQGVEQVDGEPTGDDTIGQCTAFTFVQRFAAFPGDELSITTSDDHFGFGMYHDKPDAWSRIWTYRRIRGSRSEPTPGDLCLQNWGYDATQGEGGNDYPFGYLFLDRRRTAAQRSNWCGGIDATVLAAAEKRALGWHVWFKQHAPSGVDPGQILLDRGVLGTGHGLAKLPYIRDTRRSIGLDGFILKVADLTADPRQQVARKFPDRIAIGCYAVDIHALADRKYPAYVTELPQTLPFHIPFRALTNSAYDNLLVAGKTMAQSFMANSATRLHPIEWSTGTAAGIAAARMATEGLTSRQVLATVSQLQSLVRSKTPIDWTIDEPLATK
ncbi:MAG TPA: FAD-dependent oxidoreductase [Pirellulaceae bacterium]